jgi:hypothetical protein
MKNHGEDNCLGKIARLYTEVITDVSKICGVKAVEATRDVNYLKHRLSNEGFPFVTIVLPQLGKAIGSAFQSGRLTRPGSFHGSGSGALPSFLQGLTSRVFDIETGALLDDASWICVWGLRQICFLMHKYQRPYTDTQVRDKLNHVMQVNSELPKTITAESLSLDDRTVLALARDIVTELMSTVDLSQLVPSHGPGSTASGRMNANEKTAICLLRDPKLAGFPDLYGRHNVLDVLESHFESSAGLSLEKAIRSGENTATMHFVPKDSGGPRGISCEPVWRMFAQQALRGPVERAAHIGSNKRINFKDQSVNQRLALQASLSGDMATLDMKDASDRNSYALVTELFAGTEVLPLMIASRSKINRYSNGDEDVSFHLRRFAPMGSAMCFPTESIVFWALAVATVYNVQNSTCCGGGDPREEIYTFGDDLIVPSAFASVVIDQLEKFSLIFNVDKSFVTGPFRESCGCDAFKGEIVTPIKVKALLPQSLSDVSSVVAWVDYSNAFAQQWMWGTSNYIQDMLTDLGLVDSPVCSEDVGVLRFWSYSEKYPKVSIPERNRDKNLSMIDKTTDELLQSHYRLRPYFQGVAVSGWSNKDLYSPIDDFNEGAGLVQWFINREGNEQSSRDIRVKWWKPTVASNLLRVSSDQTGFPLHWEFPVDLDEVRCTGRYARGFFASDSCEVDRRTSDGTQHLKRARTIIT